MKSAFDLIIQYKRSDSLDVRKNVCTALRGVGSPDAVDELLMFLSSDASNEVRLHATNQLTALYKDNDSAKQHIDQIFDHMSFLERLLYVSSDRISFTDEIFYFMKRSIVLSCIIYIIFLTYICVSTIVVYQNNDIFSISLLAVPLFLFPLVFCRIFPSNKISFGRFAIYNKVLKFASIFISEFIALFVFFIIAILFKLDNGLGAKFLIYEIIFAFIPSSLVYFLDYILHLNQSYKTGNAARSAIYSSSIIIGVPATAWLLALVDLETAPIAMPLLAGTFVGLLYANILATSYPSEQRTSPIRLIGLKTKLISSTGISIVLTCLPSLYILIILTIPITLEQSPPKLETITLSNNINTTTTYGLVNNPQSLNIQLDDKQKELLIISTVYNGSEDIVFTLRYLKDGTISRGDQGTANFEEMQVPVSGGTYQLELSTFGEGSTPFRALTLGSLYQLYKQRLTRRVNPHGEAITTYTKYQLELELVPFADSCTWARDGACDEPQICDPGTDTTDCRGNHQNATTPLPNIDMGGGD